MSRYASMIASAKRLITSYGQVVTWRKLDDGVPTDDDEPWKPVSARTVDISVQMVFLPDDRRGYETLAALAGTDVPRGKLIGYIAQQSFRPSLKDVVIRDGEALAIRNITPISPAGEVIMYTVEFDT